MQIPTSFLSISPFGTSASTIGQFREPVHNNYGAGYSVQTLPTDAIGSATLYLTNIIAGSEIRLYDANGNEYSGGIESSSTSLFLSYPVYSGSPVTAYLVILLVGYHPRRLPVVLLPAGVSISVSTQMQPDGAYEA